MWKWFKKIFKKEKEARLKPTGKINCVGLIVGHTQGAPGASSYNGKISEYDYWLTVAREVSMSNDNVVYGTRDRNGVKGACAEIGAKLFKRPDLLIELHYNAFNTQAAGCEALYIKDKELAQKFCDFMESKGRVNRGAKSVYSNGRGISNLETAQKYSNHCILIEPFFGDNKKDYIPISEMVKHLGEFIKCL